MACRWRLRPDSVGVGIVVVYALRLVEIHAVESESRSTRVGADAAEEILFLAAHVAPARVLEAWEALNACGGGLGNENN